MIFHQDRKEIDLNQVKDLLRDFKMEKNTNNIIITFNLDKKDGLWGFGERFDSLKQNNLKRENRVFEKFTNQGNQTYMPVPFFLSNSLGVYVDTFEVIDFSSEEVNDNLQVKITTSTSVNDIYIFKGNPSYQIKQFLKTTATPILPPKWSFGPWMSANRWDSQDLVLEQARLNKKLGFFHTVLVVEAWSDEATFYKFRSKELWPDPKKMIEELNSMGLNLILWQIPVFKKLEEGHTDDTHENDCEYAVKNNLVVLKDDGTPYTIPKGRWFEGSMIPDFTNPETKKWWFDKRQYLLNMGVSGFKTDGGEFIYDDKVKFFDGTSEKEMKNGYPLSYTKAYYEAIGKDRILFSRAGYTGSWETPLHWGGDQMSKWSELKHILIAGLNASVSGIFFWGFDIAGFAGAMPSKELYLRSFLLGTFTPVMQWHSEPIGGQFSEVMKSFDAVNDRSPWNMANLYDDESILTITRDCCNLRKKLLPYIYEEAEHSQKALIPLMKPLFLEYSDDNKACEIDDQFILGRSLLVAPIIEEGKNSRKIYLPKGRWFDCKTREELSGNQEIERNYDLSSIGLFINLESDYSLLKDILI